jgi:DNA mismatch repair protein MutL
MDKPGVPHHPVRQLSPDVARKIAAGEVIDRPAAIVRELMDNAVDSGADTITVEIAGGGIDKIRIADNGSGMTKEDLAACARPHATSKIHDEADLLTLTTLGFRGEALSSIAAVSRLSVMSGTSRMKASITEDHLIETVSPVQDGRGTIVQSEGLFENFPARRMFLKRPATETLICRETFIEKALPRTDISFRFIVDGSVRYDLPAGASRSERFVQALELSESAALFSELNGSAEEQTVANSASHFTVIIGEPSVHRADRKYMYIYVNGRRITEYSFMQAIEYGAQGYFPNGSHPVTALFITIDPALVDFNIHPAKKEARFKDSAPLHHAVSSAVRTFFHSCGIKAIQELPRTPVPVSDTRSHFFTTEKAPVSYEISHTHSNLAVQALSHVPVHTPLPDTAAPDEKDSSFRYLGTILGVFLVVEKDAQLYLIDQHAAHERILFNRILETKGLSQELLIPYVITTTTPDDDHYLERIKKNLEAAGFSINARGNGEWEFTSIPARWTGTEGELAHTLLDERVEPEEIIYHIAATHACKAAVKDGTILDPSTARHLAAEAFALKDPHCPHGRPIWTTLSKTELFALVRRTEH